MNILIKLTCLVGLVIAPILGGHGTSEDVGMASDDIRKEIKVEMHAEDSNMAKATITTSTTVDGESVTQEQVIEGTVEEVKAKLRTLENQDGERIEVKLKEIKKETQEKE
jgi:K(+)-stimulated pyrophosphate-energized sodium pump